MCAFIGTWANWQWLRLSTIYCCARRRWSRTGIPIRNIIIVLEIRVACSWIWSSCLIVQGWDAPGQWDGCICARWIWCFLPTKFECGCCEMLVFRVCGAGQNFDVSSLNRNTDLDGRIREWLLRAMAAVQAVVFVTHSCLWVTWMAIIRNGWVLLPRTVIVLRPSTLQRNQVVINWWLAQLMNEEELLTFWWLMFLT